MLTCILAGLGRALSEVGAIIIVGGNIIHYTRVMTTTIALETSKGNLSMAMSLGIVLIFISISINLIVKDLLPININRGHFIRCLCPMSFSTIISSMSSFYTDYL